MRARWSFLCAWVVRRGIVDVWLGVYRCGIDRVLLEAGECGDAGILKPLRLTFDLESPLDHSPMNDSILDLLT